MKKLYNPKWLYVINTLPLVILFIIALGQFNLMKSQFKPENLIFWNYFWIFLTSVIIISFSYAVYNNLKKKDISFLYGIFSLVLHSLLLYLFYFNFNKFFPAEIPNWMYEGFPFYIGTFFMPTLAYSLFIVVYHYSPKSSNSKPFRSLYYAFLVPLTWYIFAQVLLPLWQFPESFFMTHAFLVLFFVSSILFFFFLIRGFYLLILKRSELWQKYQLLWKIPITIIFPIIGLYLNNSYFNLDEYSGVFGNFNNIWFYILALITGILLCLPNIENKIYRFILFIGRSILSAYSLYFFLVFLPFLPFSIIGIIAFGAGFLLLTPLLLFLIHIKEITADFSYLSKYLSVKFLFTILIFSGLIIPTSLNLRFLQDKKTLTNSLDYIYNPDYSQKYEIDIQSLKKTISRIKNYKNSSDFIMSNTPFLSTYFKWLVLDNLTLSDTKIKKFENIFYPENFSKEENNKSFSNFNTNQIETKNTEITKIKIDSKYDSTHKTWRSWVNLEILNKTRYSNQEFSTTLNLPDGCWISDYYLYVGDKKEMGFLSEKKSAMWIFSQIKNERRDPGILYYLTGNKVGFKIFPFNPNELRKTGIEFIHKNPIKLEIAGNKIELGDTKENNIEIFENSTALFIPTDIKNNLKKITRKPYFHFLVDASINSKDKVESYIQRINFLFEKYPDLKSNSKFSFVNSYLKTVEFSNNWTEILKKQHFENGFFIERAIKQNLISSFQRNKNSYPIFIAITDNFSQVPIKKDFSDFKFSFPENNLFYHIDSVNNINSHSLLDNPQRFVLKDSIQIENSCLVYTSKQNSFYLPDNQQPTIIPKYIKSKLKAENLTEKNWESALKLHAAWQRQIINPAASKEERHNIIKGSFISRIMTPFTSFIAVENEAQKAFLKKKQRQVLAGNKSLDPSDEIESMSEPNIFLISTILLVILFLIKKYVFGKK